MSNFISLIQEQVEKHQRLNTISEQTILFQVNWKSLPKELIPIVKNLEALTKAKTKLKNGNFLYVRTEERKAPFYFKVDEPAHQALVIPLGNAKKIIIGYFSRRERSYYLSLPGGAKHYSDTLEEAEYMISRYLGPEIGSLGLLDKSVYKKKIQDMIGIE